MAEIQILRINPNQASKTCINDQKFFFYYRSIIVVKVKNYFLSTTSVFIHLFFGGSDGAAI